MTMDEDFTTPTKGTNEEEVKEEPAAPMRMRRRPRANTSIILPQFDLGEYEDREIIPDTDDEGEDDEIPPTPKPVPLVRSVAVSGRAPPSFEDRLKKQELEEKKREMKRKFWENFHTAMNSRIQFSDALSDILLLVILIYQWPIWICFLFVVAFRLPLVIQRERQQRITGM